MERLMQRIRFSSPLPGFRMIEPGLAFRLRVGQRGDGPCRSMTLHLVSDAGGACPQLDRHPAHEPSRSTAGVSTR